MKKITAIILSVIMVLSMLIMTGCKQKPAEELIPDAIENTSELDAFDIEYEISVDASVMGIGMEIPVKGVIQLDSIDDLEDLEAYISFEVDLSDVESLLSSFGTEGEFSDPIEGEIAYADEWLFVKYNIMGEEDSFKADVSEEAEIIIDEIDIIKDMDIKEEMPEDLSAVLDEVEDIIDELLEDAEVEKDGRNRVVELDFDTDDINDMISGVISIIGYAADISLPGFSFDELSATFTVNRKEYIVGTEATLAVSADYQGISMDVECDIEIKLNDPGSKVKVKSIRGSDDFPEIDIEDIY